MKNIFKIAVVILVVAVIAIAVLLLIYPGQHGYFSGPKDTYIKYLKEVETAKNLEEAMNITIKYGYFGTQEQKNQVASSTASDLENTSSALKDQEFNTLEGMFKQELDAASTIIESINGDKATLQITISTGKTTVNMVKDNGAWLLAQ